jgi:hypothetical protein
MEYEKKLSTLLFLICFSTIAEIRSVHCPIGCPSFDINNNDVAFNHTYALSNNPTTKFADWIAYEVNVLNFGVSAFIFCITEQQLLVTKSLRALSARSASFTPINLEPLLMQKILLHMNKKK